MNGWIKSLTTIIAKGELHERLHLLSVLFSSINSFLFHCSAPCHLMANVRKLDIKYYLITVIMASKNKRFWSSLSHLRAGVFLWKYLCIIFVSTNERSYFCQVKNNAYYWSDLVSIGGDLVLINLQTGSHDARPERLLLGGSLCNDYMSKL